jgi:hypothetical protein
MAEAEKDSAYKQISLKDAVADVQLRQGLSELDVPWQRERVRLRTASVLAIGLLALFALTIACNGSVITALVITSANSNEPVSNVVAGIREMTEFAKMLLPFIATPLGVALGYYFRETQRD